FMSILAGPPPYDQFFLGMMRVDPMSADWVYGDGTLLGPWNHWFTLIGVMINNLSTELILEILVYLDYGNIENLSWTQKRYMMIVQRHFPEALEQKIWIRKISIMPSENNSSRLQTYQVEIRLPIDDQYKDDVDPITSIQVTGYIDKHTDRRANQENYKLTFNHFKRFFEWRKSLNLFGYLETSNQNP
ncbi:hypothetical protein WR25_23804, partial [Diploscapter pachys]